MTPVNSFIYPNGIAISPDRGTLYAAEATGIDSMNIASAVIHRSPQSASTGSISIAAT